MQEYIQNLPHAGSRSRCHRRGSLALLLLLIPWSALRAEEGGPPTTAPPVDSLVQEAFRRSPSVAALRERYLAAKEMIPVRGALPDPMIEFMLQDEAFPRWTVGDMTMSMLTFEATQSIPFPGQRSAQRATDRAEAEARGVEVEAMRRQIGSQVRSLYARVYAMDRMSMSLFEAHDILALTLKITATRYETGQEEQEALAKAQLNLSRLEEQQDDLRAERAQMVAMLNKILDRPGDSPLGRVEAVPEVSPPPLRWDSLVVENASEVTLRRAQVRTAELRLAEMRRMQYPMLTAGAGYGYRGTLDRVVTLRLGVQVPIWSGQKQEPEIRAAMHELEMARADLREAEAMTRSEAARLQAQWTKADAQIQRYREQILPQSQMALDAAQASYTAGRGMLFTVLDDLGMWLMTRSELASREADRYSTLTELEALIWPSGSTPEKESR